MTGLSDHDGRNAQTRAVLRAQARASQRSDKLQVDVRPFVEAQAWLEEYGCRAVAIPFADALAELLPAANIRMRRDFPQLLTTIKTLALLHQCQRDRTPGAEILATLEDYADARDLLEPVFEALEADGLTPAVRKVVEAIGPGEAVTETDLAKRLGRSKSTVCEHVKKALAGKWLVNEERYPGYPAQLRRGEPLPDERTSLPTPEQVLTWCSAVRSESGVAQGPPDHGE